MESLEVSLLEFRWWWMKEVCFVEQIHGDGSSSRRDDIKHLQQKLVPFSPRFSIDAPVRWKHSLRLEIWKCLADISAWYFLSSDFLLQNSIDRSHSIFQWAFVICFSSLKKHFHWRITSVFLYEASMHVTTAICNREYFQNWELVPAQNHNFIRKGWGRSNYNE